jgi:hypothetical protein
VSRLIIGEMALAEVQAEAARAHAHHGSDSLYYPSATSERRLAILSEEAGEVAREVNELHHGTPGSLERLRAALVQAAAVTLTWIQALDDAESQ